MTDELERRLRAADPAGPGRDLAPSPEWISHLVESTMSEPNHTSRRRWVIPAAAAAAVLAIGIGSYAVAHHDSSPQTTPTASAPPMKLKSASSGLGSMACVRFMPSILATKPVAFSGTVTRTDQRSTVIAVDHWYRGGHSTRVIVAAPHGLSPGGPVTFDKGKRYLVSAAGGVVLGCGFTTDWTPHSAAVYAKAFG